MSKFLADQRVLTILTCGSVDDGKSTLIGRLLYEQGQIPEDELAGLTNRAEEAIDYSLLLDGLEPEREQGITIDVAYRYFKAADRHFIVADTPGHEQYVRNMITGASNSDLAILLVDARNGLTSQTFRHAHIVSIMGIRHVVLAVNKIDLVNFDERVFQNISTEFRKLAELLSFSDFEMIPVSALLGDNVSTRSSRMTWYEGPTLLQLLAGSEVPEKARTGFRMPVQLIVRSDGGGRGVAGTIASGQIAIGDKIVLLPSGRVTSIKEISSAGRAVGRAEAREAVTLTLSDHVDVARGDVAASPSDQPHVGSQFVAQIVWLGDETLRPGRSYLLKQGTRTVGVSITAIKYRVDVQTMAHEAAKELRTNEIGVCNLITAAPLVFDSYAENAAMGGLIVIDRATNMTVAAGIVLHPLTRSTTIRPPTLFVTKDARAHLKGHRPALLWLTGLSGAGKSTIANATEARLNAMGVHTILLDGDCLRGGINKDLGFTETDRIENIRRAGEVSKLMLDAGLVVLCSFISPFAADRRMVRELMRRDEFIEVFVDTPLETCIERDPKGLYRRAIDGEIKNFTGISQVYERPEHAEVTIRTGELTVDGAVDRLVAELARRGIFDLSGEPGRGHE
ncbi:adenylyl-sulfate kinase [Bradyrhizobium sp. GCM10023182]|uniref:Adenylyl-sulfate kinase n=1 Tax=Bradyrhizobium zhengyangense TaxID=2911009 RepID=A0ABS9M0I1_9BRAD|nr:adenylyl-sulfate kinase [Bradyrhizobium zhengyangense]MCG2672779.1 adenylyl-sulfate kinase [Bradyrhizobium zhengyangense]